MKPNARILDATAANRMMWRTKDHDGIMFIDVEPELEYPPDRFLDCTDTDFEDGYFNMILFDPPHTWGIPYNERIFTMPSKKAADDKFNYNRAYPSYYGLDKFKNKSELIAFIDKAQTEFMRILNPYGCLWFKWSEYSVPISNMECLFKNWSTMMKIRLHKTPRGKTESYWIMYMKRTKTIICAEGKENEEP